MGCFVVLNISLIEDEALKYCGATPFRDQQTSQRSVGSNIIGKWEKVVIRPVLCARHWWLSYLLASEHKTGVLTIAVLPESKFSDLPFTIFLHTQS